MQLKHRRERKGGDAPLIAVTEESTIANVMTVLRNEGILAVPVYRQRADGQIFTGTPHLGLCNTKDLELTVTQF